MAQTRRCASGPGGPVFGWSGDHVGYNGWTVCATAPSGDPLQSTAEGGTVCSMLGGLGSEPSTRTRVDARSGHTRWWVAAVVLASAGAMSSAWLTVVVGVATAVAVMARDRLAASYGWIAIFMGVWTYQGVVASQLLTSAIPGVDQRVAWLPLALLIVLFLKWTLARWKRDRKAPWGTLVGETLTAGVWLWILSAGRHAELPALWVVSLFGALHLTVLALVAARQLQDGPTGPTVNDDRGPSSRPSGRG